MLDDQQGRAAKAAGSAAKPEIATSDSAAAEITPPKIDRLGELITRCKAIENGKSVFKASQAHVFEALKEAYPMYQAIENNDVEHKRIIKELMGFGGRERAPSLKKAAFNATCLACHPETPNEFANASDHANMLELAAHKKIREDQFATWIEGQSIRNAKTEMRAIKRGTSQARMSLPKIKMPFLEKDFPTLTNVLARCGDAAWFARVENALKKFEAALEKEVSRLDDEGVEA